MPFHTEYAFPPISLHLEQAQCLSSYISCNIPFILCRFLSHFGHFLYTLRYHWHNKCTPPPPQIHKLFTIFDSIFCDFLHLSASYPQNAETAYIPVPCFIKNLTHHSSQRMPERRGEGDYVRFQMIQDTTSIFALRLLYPNRLLSNVTSAKQACRKPFADPAARLPRDPSQRIFLRCHSRAQRRISKEDACSRMTSLLREMSGRRLRFCSTPLCCVSQNFDYACKADAYIVQPLAHPQPCPLRSG